MPRPSIAVEEILPMLTAAPQRIAASTEDLTEEQLHTPPSEGEWSINDILAHMRACADQWGNSIETIVSQDHPTIRAINPRSWIKRTNYRELSFGESFRAYTEQRAELVKALTSLSPEDWERTATVTGAGRRWNGPSTATRNAWRGTSDHISSRSNAPRRWCGGSLCILPIRAGLKPPR